MLAAYANVLMATYYAQNYASIIHQCLLTLHSQGEVRASVDQSISNSALIEPTIQEPNSTHLQERLDIGEPRFLNHLLIDGDSAVVL